MTTATLLSTSFIGLVDMAGLAAKQCFETKRYETGCQWFSFYDGSALIINWNTFTTKVY